MVEENFEILSPEMAKNSKNRKWGFFSENQVSKFQTIPDKKSYHLKIQTFPDKMEKQRIFQTFQTAMNPEWVSKANFYPFPKSTPDFCPGIFQKYLPQPG